MSHAPFAPDEPRTVAPSPTFFGRPPGPFVLFLVEVWERFSYYGMRALLVLYLVAPVGVANAGRGFSKEAAGMGTIAHQLR